MEDSNKETYPAKVIEFIKKWVSKEKVLITNCVKTFILSIPPPSIHNPESS